MKREAIREFFRRLHDANPNPQTELEYASPYQLLVAVVLSAQATDRSVNIATRELFAVAPTPEAMVALGEDGIKTIEDFAGCAADDLVGWSERKDGETKKFEGLFSKFDISRAEAEAMVVKARLAAGWITEEDLAVETEADAEGELEGEEAEQAT